MRTPLRIVSTSCSAYLLTALPLWAARTGDRNAFDQLPPGDKLATAVLVLLVLVCVSIGLLALMALYSLLRPRTVRHGADLLRVNPGRALGTGALAALVVVGFLALSGAVPQAGPVVVAFVVWALYLLLSGLCMVTHEIGDRLQSSLQSRGAGSVVAAVLWGGLILGLVGFVPFVGQLVQLVTGVLGLGVAVQVLMADRRTRKASSLGGTPVSQGDTAAETTRSA